MGVPGIALDDWRSSNKAKRELVRAYVLSAVFEGKRINILIDRLKQESGYDRLTEADRNGFNVMASQMRAIVNGWRLVEPAMQQDFANGSIPFSRVYAALK